MSKNVTRQLPFMDEFRHQTATEPSEMAEQWIPNHEANARGYTQMKRDKSLEFSLFLPVRNPTISSNLCASAFICA